MPTTYEPIATTTLGSAVATITFSSIAATYTDLRLVITATSSTAGADIAVRYNSDTGANYSLTRLTGNGSTAASGSRTNTSESIIDSNGLSATVPSLYEVDIFSYAGSTFKTLLARTAQDFNGSGGVYTSVNLWRNTAAITSITLFLTAYNFNAGTTATLYGIKNA